MHDPLPAMAGTEAGDPALVAVAPERVHLRGAHRVCARDTVTVGRDVVVHRGNNQAGAANAPAFDPEALERLRGGHLMDEVQIHVEQ
jgi:hypothetical protein